MVPDFVTVAVGGHYGVVRTEAQQKAYLEEAVAPLVADVRRTLNPDFEVQILLDEGVWIWSTPDSARSIGEAEWYAEVEDEGPDDLARLVVKLAYEIPDFDFDDVLEPWPTCPRHADHPLYPQLRRGEPLWVCPDNGSGVICRIGHWGEPSETR